jgi:hypothetical protein
MIFVAGDRRLSQYNQYDTHLDALGITVGKFIRDVVGGDLEQLAGLTERRVEAIRELLLGLREVEEGGTPTPAEAEQYKHLARRVGGEGSWYSVLRNLQGDPAAVLTAGIMPTMQGWDENSGGCEYAYEMDFNTQVLTVWAYREKLAALRFDTPNLPEKVEALQEHLT